MASLKDKKTHTCRQTCRGPQEEEGGKKKEEEEKEIISLAPLPRRMIISLAQFESKESACLNIGDLNYRACYIYS